MKKEKKEQEMDLDTCRKRWNLHHPGQAKQAPWLSYKKPSKTDLDNMTHQMKLAQHQKDVHNCITA